MAQLPTGVITHSQKVCRVYKSAVRAVEDWYIEKDKFRYEATLLRQRFEQNRHIKDARVAKKLLLDAESEILRKRHYTPRRFPDSFGGPLYKNWIHPPDSALDFWDPVEKARYPKYFAKREELKKEYEQLYHRLYPAKNVEVEKEKEKSKDEK
ncbi:NADH dehydrogenase (ubiquinone) B22 subunit [Nomia melanderi]|uniref:NADH dehydrogenase (ubiquinone) B22 subunit n=1 Tax=Nomia melanderi TaxID=2448451 RepID=UPI0013044D03|nr:NADH dehydrogenase [ubiquinone] 1 beta subcomplex subunit 9 [Nomia melanderi]